MTIFKRVVQALRHRDVLRKLFDREYYGASFLHFVAVGAFEGRKPHPLFDPVFYLRKYPDVAAAGMNPLLHYMLSGSREGRKPHPLFQPDYYLLRCPQAKAGGLDPLMHFLESRGDACCSPHPLFDCGSYVRENPEAREVNPLVHYLMSEPALSNECAQVEIQDAKFGVVFGEEETVPQGCVRVWQDREGRTHFIAPPQQRPFFQSLNFEQLRAQV